MKKISIIGTGSWGTALGWLLNNNGHQVCMWSPHPEKAEHLKKTRENPRLPGVKLPEEMEITADLEKAVREKDLLVLAVASPYIRETSRRMKEFVRKDQIVVDVAKGIEEETLMTMTDIIEEEIPGVQTAVLSGPSHAEEVGKGLPTTCVVAARKKEVAQLVQSVFMSPVFRVYTSPDMLGVELGGALKNVIALAAGTADGLGYGDNTKAALITRGIAEISGLGPGDGSAAGDSFRAVGNRRSDRHLCQRAQSESEGWLSDGTGKDYGGSHGRSADGGGRCLFRQGCSEAF